MTSLPFKKSALVSIGVELEFPIINPYTFDLVSKAQDLLNAVHRCRYKERIKHEITQSMIEINSSIHHRCNDLFKDLLELRNFLSELGEQLDIRFCGGGTHPFQRWKYRKVFPTARYKRLAKQYRFLTQLSTVFGQHIHIGCPSGNDALYLTHCLARYIPHFIALSASSPFYQGVDTGFVSSRPVDFSSFPTSGVIPYLQSWQEFTKYFYKIKNLGIIESMKDIYWDIRPKPEFGTVELRICDAPLTIKKAVINAAYAQSLAHYIIKERPFRINHDLYYLYNHNQFQANRYGFDGKIIDPFTLKPISIQKDILKTLTIIEKHSLILKNKVWIDQLKQNVLKKDNDTKLIRKIYRKVKTLPRLVEEQCLIWETN